MSEEEEEEELVDEDEIVQVEPYEVRAKKEAIERGDVLFPDKKLDTIYVLKGYPKNREDEEGERKGDEPIYDSFYKRLSAPPAEFWRLVDRSEFAKAETEGFSGTEDEVRMAIARQEEIPETMICRMEMWVANERSRHQRHANHGLAVKVPVSKMSEVLSYLERVSPKAVMWDIPQSDRIEGHYGQSVLLYIRKFLKGRKITYINYSSIVVDNKWIVSHDKIWYAPKWVPKLLAILKERVERKEKRKITYRGHDGKQGVSKIPVTILGEMFREMERLFWSRHGNKGRVPRFMDEFPKGCYTRPHLVTINTPSYREDFIWAIPRLAEFIVTVWKKREYRTQGWFNGVLLIREKHWTDPATSGEFRRFLEKEITYAKSRGIKRKLPEKGKGEDGREAS